MAINFCDICNDPCLKTGYIGTNNAQETWRLLVAQVLCGLQSSIVASNASLPEVALGFAALESDYSTYASPGFLNNQTELKSFRVKNTTNAAIQISLDSGSSTFLTVLAGEDTGWIPVGITVVDADAFQIRVAENDTATSGTLYLQGLY